MKKITALSIFLCLSVICILLSVFCDFSFAEERITLTTYYPAPYGVYNTMVVRRLGVGDQTGDGFNESDAPTTDGDVWIAGNVGIGTTIPSARLDVNGSANISTNLNVTNDLTVRNDLILTGIDPSTSGANMYYNPSNYLVYYIDTTSSLRYKKDIRDIGGDPKDVLKLRPVRFSHKTTGQEDIGLIAEEVDQVLKDLVVYDKEGRPDSVKYDKVAIYLLGLIKEQQKEIDILNKEISTIKQQLSKEEK